MNFNAFLGHLDTLRDCTICPRNCHADRYTGRNGYCRSDASFSIASICIHQGEEPVISGSNGICNVFFSHCNLQCQFCQNHQISNNKLKNQAFNTELSDVVKRITEILDSGIDRVGFVSPSHFVPQMRVIIDAVQSVGHHPVWIYNSNGYDKPETLQSLEGIIDVYLPDLKYMDQAMAHAYSGASDYPDAAARALREMYRQKGSTLHLREDGTAESGLIIRHLVLPGHVENSLSVLRFIAEELSPRIHVSLMSQYYPTAWVADHPVLGKHLARSVYLRAVQEMEELGLDRGWIQEFESSDHYRPDFDQLHPFEK
jgi:putative pyruvate formate lyase activating enzyme